MKTINLIFGCHAHQPVGNFDFVFERAYRECYRPFLDVLEHFPGVQVTMHFTGPLLDWFEHAAPDFLDRLAALVSSGQIEMMGGGYYEPLLCAIPERDALRQIERMHLYCEKRFGAKVRGMWLTERVWEPQMAHILAKSGIEYTPLDDAHFLCSGLEPEQMFGYYMTEDEGFTVKVFPILERLRYLVPFHQVEETITWLNDQATESGTRCAVLHDDYEKFGVWPGTNKSVYKEGWLEHFFQALTENKDWLHSVTYSQYLDANTALGRTYIPCASYDEMMTWALPTAMQRELVRAREKLRQSPDLHQRCARFMRGGFWRSFLSKYEESNNIQKRMLRTSTRLDRLRREMPASEMLDEAEKMLHQGQCNCAYWHGVFGGLYLNHLRTALYEKIIASDALMDTVEVRDTAESRFVAVDFDADGNLEGILENDHIALFFKPSDGGTLFEFDYKPQPFNFGNVLTRREEVYHDQLRHGGVLVGEESGGDLSIHDLVKAKEKDLDKLLVYDPWRRVSLRDRFIANTASADSLWSGLEPELGSFARHPYTMSGKDGQISLEAYGTIAGTAGGLLHLQKNVKLPRGESCFDVTYTIHFDCALPSDILFGVELAVNFLTGNAPDRYLWSEHIKVDDGRLGVRGELPATKHLAARDDWQRLELAFSFLPPARVFRFPLDTVSQSEDGQERVHQGCILLPCWNLPGDGKEFTIDFRVMASRLID
mgnify:FL=1